MKNIKLRLRLAAEEIRVLTAPETRRVVAGVIVTAWDPTCAVTDAHCPSDELSGCRC